MKKKIKEDTKEDNDQNQQLRRWKREMIIKIISREDDKKKMLKLGNGELGEKKSYQNPLWNRWKSEIVSKITIREDKKDDDNRNQQWRRWKRWMTIKIIKEEDEKEKWG
jgi:hypothetical protein